jgi:hypothetical protein
MAKASDRSTQFNLLLQQKYIALNMIDRANEELDDKASKILQASSLIIALTGLLVSPFVGASITGASGFLVASIILTFMLMVGLSIVSVSPKMQYLPGTQSWDENYTQYIYGNVEDSFNQILSDCLKTIDLLTLTNSKKANLVRWSAALLLLQISALLILLFISTV